MATSDMVVRLDSVKKDLDVVTSSPNFVKIQNHSELLNPWNEAKSLALKWLTRAKPRFLTTEDVALRPLEAFARRLVDIADGREVRPNEDIPTAIRRIQNDFLPAVPVLAYELLEASGIFQLSENALSNWRESTKADLRQAVDQAEQSIKAIVAEADRNLKASAIEAGKDFELAKERSQKITVDSAERQFQAADRSFRFKKTVWVSITIAFFVALILLLTCLLTNPPTVIQDVMDAMKPGSKAIPIPVSIPLLLAASAYFTTLRLAFIGILGIGLAFSLRMSRAYFHMIEHNEHKLRVTRSIEAFVAAVRGDDRKDLVLSKLVESVTEFGDVGILGQEEKPSGLPSVIFENLTKNVGKSD